MDNACDSFFHAVELAQTSGRKPETPLFEEATRLFLAMLPLSHSHNHL
jgi:hypothetical protein